MGKIWRDLLLQTKSAARRYLKIAWEFVFNCRRYPAIRNKVHRKALFKNRGWSRKAGRKRRYCESAAEVSFAGK
jgi:hypothetical protein